VATFTHTDAHGNDFLLVDAAAVPDQSRWPALARRVCDRATGIGADGLIFVTENAAGAAMQLRTRGAEHAPHVVAGRQRLGAQFARRLQQVAELDPLVAAHARYLTQNKNAKMIIQGNTDERGSREYNLALGQRRADAVKQMMTVLGAEGSRVETVSFGEEKPRAQGHDEAAWAENRRADIRYK